MKRRLLVNIRGTNGAGKSTIPLQMMVNDTDNYEISVYGDGKNPKLTVFPNYGWIALGTYKNKTGGMDTFKNNQQTLDALDKAIELSKPDGYLDKMYDMNFDILMEGVISSTIYSTYTKLLQAKSKEIPWLSILVLNFLPSVEICIDRVIERNGNANIDKKAIRSKWNTVQRNHYRFKHDGLKSIIVNNENTPVDSMLKLFLRTVEKHRN